MATIQVLRGPEPKKQFRKIANHTLRGEGLGKLSDRAFRLGLYFESMSDEGWTLDRGQLDKKFPGPKKNEAALRELKAAGWLKMERRQVTRGGPWAWSWIYTDNPIARPLDEASTGVGGDAAKGSLPSNGGMGPTSEDTTKGQVTRAPSMGEMEPTSENGVNPQVVPSPSKAEISTEDGLLQKTEEKTSAGAAPDSAGAAPPLRVGGAATTNNADPWDRPQPSREQPAQRDSRTWRQLLDDDDRDTIMERIADEVAGVDGGEETMAESMLDRSCHPKMIINTIMAERGTPNSPVTATVQRFAQLADTQIAAHGRQWTHEYRQRLAGAIRECVNEGWTDDQLIWAIQAEVDHSLELESQRDPWAVPA